MYYELSCLTIILKHKLSFNFEGLNPNFLVNNAARWKYSKSFKNDTFTEINACIARSMDYSIECNATIWALVYWCEKIIVQ